MNPDKWWKRLSLSRREAVLGYLFISPWLVKLLGFTLGPMLASFILSFTDLKFGSPLKFVGVANFAKMFTADRAFWDALKVTVTYAVFAVPIGLVLALLAALLLNQNMPGVRVWRTIYYLPSVVAGVAVALLWVWIFHPEFGLINLGLRSIGIQGPGWLRDPEWALRALILMSFWGIGNGMVINLAGLQSIPTELYESASIDGANWWHRLRYVTWPMLAPTTFFIFVMSVIAGFQGSFTQVYILTKGGPAGATTTVIYYIYQNAFRFFDFGYASAVSAVLFLILLALTVLAFRTLHRRVHYA